jgi:hypothetical protein
MADYELLVVNSSIPPTKSLQANMLIMQSTFPTQFQTLAAATGRGYNYTPIHTSMAHETWYCKHDPASAPC